MKYALWAAQILLGLAFLMAGVMKATTPIAELATSLPWVADLPTLTRVIGVAELAGGIGLILPAATRIKPILTPIAAGCLAVVMLLALGFHIMRGEYMIAPNVVLMSLALFIAYGRTKLLPIEPRGTEAAPSAA